MIGKFFLGIWHALNFSRRLVLNFLFFFLIIAAVLAALPTEKEPQIAQNSVLRLNLSGKLVEQLTYVDPVDAAMGDIFGKQDMPKEMLVDDVVDTINIAANDARIKALYLDLRHMHYAHLDKLRDIASAIEGFKAANKKVFAHSPYFSQSQYYLAAHADEVSIHPYGGINISGYGSYPMYFKDALEKLKVTQHIFRVGTYKSAVEPFIRNDMSEAAKEANQMWLNALWAQYKQDVANKRGFDTANFDETLTQFVDKMASVTGDSAQFAVKYGWVDKLETDQEFNQKLIELVGTQDNGKRFKQVAFEDYYNAVASDGFGVNPFTDKVAVVVAKGNIVDGKRKAGMIGGDSTAALLRQARLDEKVKAVVLRIDSGGGSMFASEIIRNEVLAIKAAGKPVIASMGSVAASGGYWIAASANEIWASPSTITGSIGVFGTILTFENSLKELGIYSDGVATTELKSSSLARGLDPKFAHVLQMGVEDAYNKFISVIADSRNLPVSDVDNVAQGRVWLATQAQEFGLVDKLGTKQEAIEAAAQMANLEHYDVFTVEQTLSEKEQLLQDIFGSAAVQSLLTTSSDDPVTQLSSIANQGLSQLLNQVRHNANLISQFNDPNNIYTLCTACVVAE
ncbi:signal peptide peptidase SppA [Pseudoalteromonas sp. R3]|uniref:signal peptide peptidase SppA n=1 Tax=Pseudoalteromonas sp. R3 TaxID=1709477 RepID=UPI0006B410B0|nr:signal peptide peptidase SppA [Pseudoalteromonas sp. R3]QAA00076.1 signal peptide peptidase SppA [Pseudoalteromonas sp. R3]